LILYNFFASEGLSPNSWGAREDLQKRGQIQEVLKQKTNTVGGGPETEDKYR
jgi:hypothetical protein